MKALVLTFFVVVFRGFFQTCIQFLKCMHVSFNLNSEKSVHTICKECSFPIHLRNMVHVVLSFYSWLLCHISIQEVSMVTKSFFLFAF